jgi:hypothetical protein
LFIIAGAGGFLVIFCVFLALVSKPGRAKAPIDTGIAELFGTVLPMEELFLAEEPDFLPPVLFERPRRDSWTLLDAEAYWEDPLNEGPELYEGIIRRIMDGIMEKVP